MVAKSYQSLKQLCEPYEKNKKMYVDVLCKNGNVKTVRWYNAQEYAKMYPEDKISDTSIIKSLKNVLGFQKGYITIFKGAKPEHEEWFERSICRYAVHWGWYIVSEDPIPDDVPEGLELVHLPWSAVEKSLEAGGKDTRTVCEKFLFTESKSRFIGEISARIDFTATLSNISEAETYYGHSKVYKFIDTNENVYMWTTTSKCALDLNETYNIRGTVKDHREERGEKITVLTRCLCEVI